MDVVHYHLNHPELLTKPTRKGVVPVHIFSQENFQGCGTLILGPHGEHRNIFTAGHLFPIGGMGGYHYKVLQPLSQQCFPLQIAKSIPGLKEDLAICRPGSHVTPIFGFSDQHPGVLKDKINSQFTSYLDPLPHAIHILSGKKIPIVGMMATEAGERYFVLGMEAFPGESGLGFLEPERENALYVLKGSVLDKDDPAFAKLTQDYPHLSLAALMGYA